MADLCGANKTGDGTCRHQAGWGHRSPRLEASAWPDTVTVVPNKVYQGMAAGCAVITSRTAPQVRMLEGTVRFVEPASPQALASAIREMRDHTVRTRWQRRAQEHAKANFSPTGVVAPLDRVLREELGRSQDSIT